MEIGSTRSKGTKPQARKYAAYTILVGYLAAVVWVLTSLDTSSGVSSIKWHEFALLFLLAAAVSGSNAVILRLSCSVFRCSVSWIEALGLTSASGLLNTLPVRVGTGFKGLYLVYLRGLPVSAFASIAGVTAAVALVTIGFMGETGVILNWLSEGAFGGGLGVLAVAYAAMLVSGVAILILGPAILRLKFPRAFHRFISSLSNATTSLVANPGFVAKVALMSVLGVALIALRLHLISDLLDEPVNLSAALLLATAGAVTTWVSIVPGGLGLREGAISGTFVAVGGGLEAGVVIATVDRVVGLIRDLVVGAPWIFVARRNIGHIFDSEPKVAPSGLKPTI